MSEKSLIRNLKKGKEEAYIQLIEKYGNRLLGTCYLILKSEVEAEDIVQETFIRVFQKIDSFKGKSGLYTWIYAIALNLARDKLRNKEDNLYLDAELTGVSDVEFQVERNIDRELLRDELFKMNDLYREVLVLFYFEELSIKEISNLLNEKEGTIKSKLSRGRNILKESLLKGGRLNG